MIHSLAKARQKQLGGQAQLAHAIVTAKFGQDRWQLDHQREARQAFSCLVTPKVNDVVTCYCQDGQWYVLAILHRPNYNKPAAGQIGLPGHGPLAIEASQLTLNSGSELQLNSVGDISLCSAGGSIKQWAANLYQTVQESLVQLSRHFVNRAENTDLQASQVMKSHGAYQMITADKDIKVDADRINMG